MQQANGLRFEGILQRRRVIQVIQSVASQKSPSVQYHQRVGEQETRLEGHIQVSVVVERVVAGRFSVKGLTLNRFHRDKPILYLLPMEHNLGEGLRVSADGV